MSVAPTFTRFLGHVSLQGSGPYDGPFVEGPPRSRIV